MAAIYVPEHFRKKRRIEIIEDLKNSGKYNLSSSTAHSRLTTFPSNLHLWDGRSVVVDETRFNFAQIPTQEPNRFTRESLIAELIEIIGESPSSTTLRRNGGYALATYDNLENREHNGINYGNIQRTQLVISPQK